MNQAIVTRPPMVPVQIPVPIPARRKYHVPEPTVKFLVGSPDAPVIYHGEILILDKKVIATVPEGRGVCLLLVHAVAVVILLGKCQQALVVALLLEFVKPSRVVGKLEVSYRGVEDLIRRRYLVLLLLLLGDILFQVQCNLIYFLRNQRSRPFHVEKRCFDELRRLFQRVEPAFQVGAAVLLDMLRHAVALRNQRTAEFGHQFLLVIRNS